MVNAHFRALGSWRGRPALKAHAPHTDRMSFRGQGVRPPPVVFGHRDRPSLARRPRDHYPVAMLDFDTCNAARLRHDPACDGVFFIGVRTTKIYCRPICRAGPALTKNLSFYPSAASAERHGFRPCLRCRPESAPFSPAWNGTRSTVSRALKLIEEGALDTGSVTTLAERLGVGARHLSRLFAEHVDASPLEVAQTRRIARAKVLLDTTLLSMPEIALRAGFPSARRMSAQFAKLYGRPPSAFRMAAPKTGRMTPKRQRGENDHASRPG